MTCRAIPKLHIQCWFRVLDIETCRSIAIQLEHRMRVLAKIGAVHNHVAGTTEHELATTIHTNKRYAVDILILRRDVPLIEITAEEIQLRGIA